MSARPLLVSFPWVPDVLRLPSFSPVLAYERMRLPSKIFHLNYGGLRDRISEVAPVHKVCWMLWNLVRVHLCLANMCLHFDSRPVSWLEVETGGGRKLPFPGIMQEYSKTLLRSAPLQRLTEPLQLCRRALFVSARPLPVSARPLLVPAPSMPDVPRFLSVSSVLLCQRSSLPSKVIPRAWRALETDSPSKNIFPGRDA